MNLLQQTGQFVNEHRGMKRKHQEANGAESSKKPKQQKSFDFSVYPKRKIAIRFFYYGWMYDGLVQQRDTPNTVEKHIIDALVKTRLIESGETCDFSRSGRTDKGVSAFKQVAAFVSRSATLDDGAFWGDDTSEDTKRLYNSMEDLPYLKMLNGVLPQSIRVTSWAKVPLDFSARFACSARTYKYAIPRAAYDIEKLRAAAQLLVGSHDYRNFCQAPGQFARRKVNGCANEMARNARDKIDTNAARVHVSYVRNIYSITVEQVSGDSSSPTRYDLIELTVCGSGFLWHMIRFIVGVLHEIGLGHEPVELISDLLDIEKTPRRPVYAMAVDSPLCLFDCRYDKEGLTLPWVHATEQVAEKNLISLQKMWAESATRARMLQNMIEGLREDCGTGTNEDKGLQEFVQDKHQSDKYVPFSARNVCDSLQEKAEKLETKRLKKEEEWRDPSKWPSEEKAAEGDLIDS